MTYKFRYLTPAQAAYVRRRNAAYREEQGRIALRRYIESRCRTSIIQPALSRAAPYLYRRLGTAQKLLV